MSEWFYVGLCYGITWLAFGAYVWRLHARRAAALRSMSDRGGNA